MKDRRIKAEIKVLEAMFKDLPKDRKRNVDGLIKRISFMRITLEDLEEDINRNGIVESFTQSEKTDPYERERPCIRVYNTMIKNYMTAVKILTDLLPPEEKKNTEDELMEFIKK